MDKKTACHELADLNERVYELEKSLENIRILIATCKPTENIKNAENFLKSFYDIIHS